MYSLDQPRTAAAGRLRSLRGAASRAAASPAPIRARTPPGMTIIMTRSLSSLVTVILRDAG